MTRNVSNPWNGEGYICHVILFPFQNVMFVISAVEGGKCHEALKRYKPTEVTVGGLDMFDKADVVRNNLAVYGKALDESPFNNQVSNRGNIDLIEYKLNFKLLTYVKFMFLCVFRSVAKCSVTVNV